MRIYCLLIAVLYGELVVFSVFIRPLYSLYLCRYVQTLLTKFSSAHTVMITLDGVRAVLEHTGFGLKQRQQKKKLPHTQI